jgi:hypothetical protein
MTIQTATQKNTLAAAYATAAAWMAAYTTAPGASAGTEPSGGSPAYARKAPAWGGPSNGVVAAAAVSFDIPSGNTIVGCGFHSAAVAGNYLDGASVTSQAFASQGTYSITPTYTQT